MPRRSQAEVSETRADILRTAVAEMSVQGFEAASIGTLAARLGMSKSGLIRHFGDKEHLQMAAFDAAMDLFVLHVWQAAEDVRPGMQRLLALCDAWLDFHAAELLPGGCLMTTAVVEFDARRGPVHENVARGMRRWYAALEREVAVAIQDGDLPADTDPTDIAFELNALASAASTTFKLYGDHEAIQRARRLMRQTLQRPR